MPAKKSNLVKKVIKITPQQQEMLDEVLDKWGIVSESEAIRQAITFWYRKMEPEYLKPSPKQTEKERELREKKRMETMSDEDYALEVMQARVFTARDGKRYAVIMTIANTIRVIPLEKVKSLDESDGFFRETHLKMLAEGVDFDAYLKRSDFKLKNVGIDLDELETKNENQNKWNNQEAENKESG